MSSVDAAALKRSGRKRGIEADTERLRKATNRWSTLLTGSPVSSARSVSSRC